MAQIPLSETASADRPEFDKLRDDKTSRSLLMSPTVRLRSST
jgi:hypothetical protein